MNANTFKQTCAAILATFTRETAEDKAELEALEIEAARLEREQFVAWEQERAQRKALCEARRIAEVEATLALVEN